MDSGPPPYSPSPYPSNRSSEQTHLRPGGHNQSGYGAMNDNRGAKHKRGVSHWLTLFIIFAFSVAISAFVTSQLMRGYWHREIDSLNYEKRKILERENMVTGREKKIAGREEEVQHETERLSFLDRQLKSREARIADEKREIAGREEKVQHETERLSILDRQLKYKEARIIGEQEKINDQKEDLRRERERLGLDAERIARSNVHWGPLKWDEACVSWKKMRYSAELEMLPQDVDGIAWCHAMSIDIFGTTFKEPDYCEKTLDGRVIGHWTRTDEPHCNTYWGNKQDWGCQPGVPGYRRIKMQLLDHHQPWEETWFALCETTPWPGHGTPENCENGGGHGIWGEWRLRDHECQE